MTVRCTGAPDGHLLTVTLPDAVLIQFDLLMMRKILLETCTVENCNKCIKICASSCSLSKVTQNHSAIIILLYFNDLLLLPSAALFQVRIIGSTQIKYVANF